MEIEIRKNPEGTRAWISRLEFVHRYGATGSTVCISKTGRSVKIRLIVLHGRPTFILEHHKETSGGWMSATVNFSSECFELGDLALLKD
jgi:hypothetical protein